MSDVNLTFESDIRKLEANNARLEKQLASLREGLRSVKTTSKEATDTWAAGLEKVSQKQSTFSSGLSKMAAQAKATRIELDLMAGSRSSQKWLANLSLANREMSALPKMAKESTGVWAQLGRVGANSASAIGSELRGVGAQLIGVTALAHVATQAYTAWAAEMERAGEKHAELSHNIVKTIVASGDIAQGSKIEAALGGLPGATKEQGTQAFAGVTGAAPLASLDRRLEMTREVAKQAPTGADLGQFGGLVGSLSDLFPKTRSAENIADVAAQLESRAGAGAERMGGDKFLRSMKSLIASGGVLPEEALGTGLAAMDANVSPGTIQQAAELAAKSKDPKATWRRLMSDKSFARQRLGAGAEEFNRIDRDAALARTGELYNAQYLDTAASRVEGLGGFEAGREALATQDAAVRIDAAGQIVGPREAKRTRAREVAVAEASPSGFVARTATQAAHSRNELAGTGFMGVEVGKQLIDAIRGNTQAVKESNQKRGGMNVDRHQE